MAPPSTSELRLVVRTGPGAGRRLAIPAEGLVLGRDVEGAGRLEDDATVSARHARLRRTRQGSVVVEDLDSSNGTYVNGELVDGVWLVEPGDAIVVGRTELSVEQPADADPGIRAAAASGGVGISGSVHAADGSIGAVGTIGGNVDLSRVHYSEHDHSGLRFISESSGLARLLMFAGVFVSIVGIALFGYPIVRELSSGFDSGPSCAGLSGQEFADCVEEGLESSGGPDLTPWVPLGLGVAFAGIVMSSIGFALARPATGRRPPADARPPRPYR